MFSILLLLLLFTVFLFLSINHIDVPFINGEYNYTSTAFYRLSTNHVYSDSSILFLLILFILVSSSLANQIKSHLYTLPNNTTCGVPLVIENDDDCNKLYETGWSSIVVKEIVCYDFSGSLRIADNDCLQYIYFEMDTFTMISSFELSNLPSLSVVRVEWESLYSAVNVTLESSFLLLFIHIKIFLN